MIIHLPSSAQVNEIGQISARTLVHCDTKLFIFSLLLVTLHHDGDSESEPEE